MVVKKILIVAGSITGVVVVCAAVLAGWFFAQMKDMHAIETGRIGDGVYAIKGGMANMFLVKAGEGYVAFDATDDRRAVARELAKLSIDPGSIRAVFLTHSDWDHTAGLPLFSNATFYLSNMEVPVADGRIPRHFKGLSHRNSLPVSAYTGLPDGDSVDVDGVVVHCIATPGHTPGSMSYRVGEALFVGDLCLLKNTAVIPMAEVFTEDMHKDMESIRRIAQLPIKSIYTAHAGFTEDATSALTKWR
jgi:glyoxylase-like metal-dependent hydrolase (beta-lactamase superfamily II)